jgi:hypothetical protein
MYGMFAMLESIRQLHGEAFRQVPGVEVSFVQAIGGVFGAAAALVFANQLP